MKNTGEGFIDVMYMPFKEIIENYYIAENYDEIMMAGFEYQDLANIELECDQNDYERIALLSIKKKMSPIRAFEYDDNTDPEDVYFELYEGVDDEY